MDTDVAGCTGEAWGGSGSAAGRLVETGVGERTDPSSTAGQCATCQAWIDVGKEHLLTYTPSNVVQCDRCHGAETVGGRRGETGSDLRRVTSQVTRRPRYRPRISP